MVRAFHLNVFVLQRVLCKDYEAEDFEIFHSHVEFAACIYRTLNLNKFVSVHACELAVFVCEDSPHSSGCRVRAHMCEFRMLVKT